MNTVKEWNNLETWVQDLIWAEQKGRKELDPTMDQHYTLSGIRVLEPHKNWGMDYYSLKDAVERGCEPLKPSIFGCSGTSKEEVLEILEKYKHLL